MSGNGLAVSGFSGRVADAKKAGLPSSQPLFGDQRFQGATGGERPRRQTGSLKRQIPS
jgi:hypothetical protein